MVIQLIDIFHAIKEFKGYHHWTTTIGLCPEPLESSSQFHTVYLRTILILPSHLCPGLFPSYLTTTILYAFFIFPMYGTFPAHLLTCSVINNLPFVE